MDKGHPILVHDDFPSRSPAFRRFIFRQEFKSNGCRVLLLHRRYYTSFPQSETLGSSVAFGVLRFAPPMIPSKLRSCTNVANHALLPFMLADHTLWWWPDKKDRTIQLRSIRAARGVNERRLQIRTSSSAGSNR